MGTFRFDGRTVFMAAWLLATGLFAMTIGTPAPAEAGSKRYYVTVAVFDGSQALTACDAGFHMASLWEIRDTSNLTYDTRRGATFGDAGDGPPASFGGWIRTGRPAAASPPPGLDAPGLVNCNAWTSNAVLDRGTAVLLFSVWSAPATVISPWAALDISCSTATTVWC